MGAFGNSLKKNSKKNINAFVQILSILQKLSSDYFLFDLLNETSSSSHLIIQFSRQSSYQKQQLKPLNLHYKMASTTPNPYQLPVNLPSRIPHFDFRLYKPKKPYCPPSLHPDAQITAALDQYESQLHSHPHWQDLDRLSYSSGWMRWQDRLQRNIFFWLAFTLMQGWVLTTTFYGYQRTRRRMAVATFKCGLMSAAILFAVTVKDERWQIQNRAKYKQMAQEVRVYRELDQKMDFFRDAARLKTGQLTQGVTKGEFDGAVRAFYQRAKKMQREIMIQKTKGLLQAGQSKNVYTV